MGFWKLAQCSILIIIIGLCFKDSTVVNCLQQPSNRVTFSNKNSDLLPIETIFKLPTPLPTWPSGGGFASGTIDLGELQVSQVSSFNKIWATSEGGPDNLGATFYEPSPIPEGFFMLGSYSQPNYQPLYGWVLVAKDILSNSSQGALKMPIDYTLVWSSESKNIKQDGFGYIWLPTAPEGYKSMGHIITNSHEKPPLEKIRCVRSDLTALIEADTLILGPEKGFNVYSSRPFTRGPQALSVPTGTFVATHDADAISFGCLKNMKYNLSAMPNLNQIEALVQAYSPLVYFHPHEEFLPSRVSWFFENGALLYTSGEESNPVPIDSSGSKLPQNGSNDGAYWLGPKNDDTDKDNLKKGNLGDARSYLHIKPTLGATFTDIVVWIFYPFNGAAKLKFLHVNIKLGTLGEHVGDWEHVTLRVSNFNGELKSVYFSQHSKGAWLSASVLEFEKGNKPVIYASLHGHLNFPKAGLVVIGTDSDKIGLRNDMDKGKNVMDTGAIYMVIGAEYLGPSAVDEQPWTNFAGQWGPSITYKLDDVLKKLLKVISWLPIGQELELLVQVLGKLLPIEVFTQQAPVGPKWKDNWSGDERVLAFTSSYATDDATLEYEANYAT